VCVYYSHLLSKTTVFLCVHCVLLLFGLYTYGKSHTDQIAREACSAANKAAANKIVKYGALSASHIFLPVVVETAGT